MQVTLNHIAFKKKGYRFLQFAMTFGCLLWMTQLVSLSEIITLRVVGVTRWVYLVVAILLMPINWCLEAKKWQILLQQTVNISLKESLFQVLNGVLYSWVIPFTAGDVLARLERNADKKKAGQSIVLNRFASFLVAAIFGVTGITIYFYPALGSWPLYSMLFLFTLLYLLLIFRKEPMLASVFALSGCRYFIISVQFFLVIRLFTDIGTTIWLLSGISWVLFFRSIVPSLFGAIGVREISAVAFFACCVDTEIIIGSSLLLWLINLVLVTLLFSFFKMYQLTIVKAHWI